MEGARGDPFRRAARRHGSGETGAYRCITFLVTGGSRGIGLAIARRLAASGDYNVIAVARRESGELAAAVREAQRRLHFCACDLAAIDAIPAFAKSVRDEFGAIYGLINNAGIGTDGLLRHQCTIPKSRP